MSAVNIILSRARALIFTDASTYDGETPPFLGFMSVTGRSPARRRVIPANCSQTGLPCSVSPQTDTPK